MLCGNRRWLLGLLVLMGTTAGLRAEPVRCRWKGIYPTVVTPFRSSTGGVDVVSLQKQIARELHNGVHGLVVLDTLGEGEFVNQEERQHVIQTAVKLAFPNAPVIVGIHTRDLAEAQAQMTQAQKLGASAVLVKYRGNANAPPDVVYHFYLELSRLHALPIFYDHNPSATGLQLTPEDVASILSIPSVVGVKESTTNLDEVAEHVRYCRELGKVFFSDTALNLTHFLDLGGHGAMCPEAVLLPAATVQAYECYFRGDYGQARSIQEQLYATLPILRLKPTMPVIMRVAYMTAQDMNINVPSSSDQPQAQMKSALACLGVATPAWVKCPLPELTVWDQRCVKAAVCKIRDLDCCESHRRIPPIPYRTCGEPDSGALLRTGAFELGHGVSQDLLRSQGNGLQGLPIE